MIGPQLWHPNIIAMRNFYVDKSLKTGNRRLNLILDYAKQGDLSKVSIYLLNFLVSKMYHRDYE